MMTPDLHNESQQSGYIYELVESLKKQMGFNYIYKVAPIELSYDELVEYVQNNTYEVLMADLAITSSRTDKIDFSYPVYDNTMRLVVRKSYKTTINTFAFLKPFSWRLWLLIVGLIYLCSAALIALYEFCGQNDEQNDVQIDGQNVAYVVEQNIAYVVEQRIAHVVEQDVAHIIGKHIAQVVGHIAEVFEQSGSIQHKTKKITTIRSLYHTIGALLQRGSELQPKTFFARLQTVVVWLMSVILVALLTSNLTIYFNAQREKPRFQSINDLQKCHKVACNRIGIIQGSQHEEYFTKEIINGSQMNYYRLKHPDECYQKLLDNEIDVAIADSSSADYFTQTPGYCQLEVAGIPFGETYFGIAFQKQWRYKQDLDKGIMYLKLNGEIDRLLKKWFEQKNCDGENGNENNGLGDGLTIQETSGLFFIFGSITFVNFIAFLLCKKGYFKCNPRPSTAGQVDDVKEAASAAEQNHVPQRPVSNRNTPPSIHENPSTDRSSAGDNERTRF